MFNQIMEQMQQMQQQQMQGVTGGQAPPKYEPEEDNGVPLPPGFTYESLDVQSRKGRNYVEEVKESISKSIAFTPLVTVAPMLLQSFFFRKMPYLVVSRIFMLLGIAARALISAFSGDKRIDSQKRLVLIASAIGFVVFSTFLAYSCGIFSETSIINNVDPVPIIVDH